MEHLLFVGYLVLFAWFITKTKFFLDSGLSKPQLIILFLLKVIAGIFYGWVGVYYGGLAQMLDTWGYHYHGLIEYRLLQDNPREYFTNLFHNPYENGFQNFFGSSDSYWNDLKGNVIIKFISIFHIFSFGNYYTNVIFYSYVSLFGPIAFYRVMNDVFPGRKLIILLVTFCLPSFLYWSSGIHKEGLIFLGISLIIYHIYFGTKEKKTGIKRITGTLLGLALLLLLRNFLLLIIIPAVIAWLVANKWPQRGLACFAIVYAVFCTLFFTLRYIDPRLDFPKAVVDKRQAFIEMKGGYSSVPIKQLKPDVISFLKNVPQAITLSVLKPYPGDVRHLLLLAAAVEIDLLLFFFLISIIWPQKKISMSNNLVYFCLFFGLSLLLAVGFSVNNLGAIVRYRSVTIPLLVVLIAIRIDWEKIATLSIKNIKFKNNITDPD